MISMEEMKQYYSEHRSDFVLRDHALRVRYAIIDKDLEGLDAIAKKMKRHSNLDSLDLSVFCQSNAKRYSDRSYRWIYLKDLLEEVPLDIDEEMDDFFKAGRFIDKEVKGDRLMMAVVRFKRKGGVSPFGMEKERIRNTLLNGRKVAMLEELRSNLFSDAIRSGDIEILGE